MFMSRSSHTGNGANADLRSNGKEVHREAQAGATSAFSSEPSSDVLFDLLRKRAEFTPVRLNATERTILGMCEGALEVSEYTDGVDVSASDFYTRERIDKLKTVITELETLLRTLLGLRLTHSGAKNLSRLLPREELNEAEIFFQDCFEVARRFKIMNPDKLRTNYGKMLYALMDSVMPRVRRSLGMDLRKDIRTVKSRLAEFEATANATRILDDRRIVAATREIMPGAPASAAQAKRKAIAELVEEYQCPEAGFHGEEIQLLLASMEDHESLIRSYKGPVERMIQYLKGYFDPDHLPENKAYSLRIRYGKGGSKLDHSHQQQYHFVLQSLILWREIMSDFLMLWSLAEQDLVDDRNGYRLTNTGQGMQRCQSAPRVQQSMNVILNRVKREVGRTWEGISVVHLGDRDVPNALVYLDKYCQVPRILAPIVKTLDSISTDLMSHAGTREFIERTFGSQEDLKMIILSDYFRHGFDGSGDDGGSCIDGRLTSSWNWCAKIEKKSYYAVFLLSGFIGFDGDFRA